MYVIGAQFTLRIDHKPLEWLISAKKSRAHSQRLEHWSLKLRAYEFDIAYQPGRQNQVANALSRCPVNLVTLNPPVSTTELSQAQATDPVLKPVIDYLLTTDTPLQESGELFLTKVLNSCGPNALYMIPSYVIKSRVQ